jgi:hypothetical protein
MDIISRDSRFTPELIDNTKIFSRSVYVYGIYIGYLRDGEIVPENDICIFEKDILNYIKLLSAGIINISTLVISESQVARLAETLKDEIVSRIILNIKSHDLSGIMSLPDGYIKCKVLEINITGNINISIAGIIKKFSPRFIVPPEPIQYNISEISNDNIVIINGATAEDIKNINSLPDVNLDNIYTGNFQRSDNISLTNLGTLENIGINDLLYGINRAKSARNI